MPDITPPDPPDLIGSKEAAQILGDVDRTTLTRWVKDGRIPTVGKLPGKSGALLFDRAVIEAQADRIAADAEPDECTCDSLVDDADPACPEHNR